jgi:hypothetical protein
MKAGRAISAIGGFLVFAGLILNLPTALLLIDPNLKLYPLPALIAIGGIALIASCGLAMFLVENGFIVIVTGTIGAISSYLFVGGIIGVIGGILGLVGGAIQVSTKSGATPTEEQVSITPSQPAPAQRSAP